jgi:Holliday junction resolvasome RuvABC endonuclease subunit
MLILALDLATVTGWALVSDGRVIESGAQDFTKRRGESNGLLFLRARKWLAELAAMQRPGLVAYEAAHFRGGAATEICVGLQTRAQELAAELGVESAPVPTSTLKKWATGSGSADKAAMVIRAAQVLRRQPIDDNEADAVLLGLYAAELYDAKAVRSDLSGKEGSHA